MPHYIWDRNVSTSKTGSAVPQCQKFGVPCRFFSACKWGLILLRLNQIFHPIFSNQQLTQYALLTYGNMPVQPRFRVKFLLKFKYENVVRLAFQKKFYSKTRMDGHITIREKSVLAALRIFSACFLVDTAPQ